MVDISQIERERQFHDELAQRSYSSRAFINRMTQSFYDKQIVWKPVWQEIGNLKGKIVLDYGCGTGGFGIELAKRGAIVYGIDISEIGISIAKQKVTPDMGTVQFLVQDAHSTNFPNEMFDFIFGNGILHHLEIERAYAEIERILKPGGCAFFMEPLDRHPGVWLVRKLTPQARSKDERPLNFGDIDKARDLFRTVSHTEYFLFATIAASLNLVSSKIARFLTVCFSLLDKFLFTIFPWCRKYAWITMITLEK